MGIGNNVKKYRLKLGMDQKSLAVKLGVTSGAVSNYENDLSSPREDVLYKMFEVLGVTPNELFDGCFAEIKKSPVPEGTEDREQIVDALASELRGLLVKFGLLDPDGDLTADQLDFLLHLVALLQAYFKK
jgi:transcriptional regulator with XRE-family HTH domain